MARIAADGRRYKCAVLVNQRAQRAVTNVLEKDGGSVASATVPKTQRGRHSSARWKETKEKREGDRDIGGYIEDQQQAQARDAYSDT